MRSPAKVPFISLLKLSESLKVGSNPLLSRGNNLPINLSAGLLDVQQKELNFQLNTLLRTDI